ncbi:hypothetical protein [Lysinibacillus sp. FW12]|uniref:hypothetical protein n=1 Tax=Lysinibacillus sp. FW12 TaxID=3096079 RepID=UPI003D74FE51
MSVAKTLQAFDIDGNELERGDIVEIIKGGIDHGWLTKGNKMRVSHWDNRSFGIGKYIVVFLETKTGGRLCQRGVHEKDLRKVVAKQ